jgi:hypothetical protein
MYLFARTQFRKRCSGCVRRCGVRVGAGARNLPEVSTYRSADSGIAEDAPAVSTVARRRRVLIDHHNQTASFSRTTLYSTVTSTGWLAGRNLDDERPPVVPGPSASVRCLRIAQIPRFRLFQSPRTSARLGRLRVAPNSPNAAGGKAPRINEK